VKLDFTAKADGDPITAATGFKVCAFPLKVKGGSAGPARVVAMMDEA